MNSEPVFRHVEVECSPVTAEEFNAAAEALRSASDERPLPRIPQSIQAKLIELAMDADS
jgi:hypothetical protein